MPLLSPAACTSADLPWPKNKSHTPCRFPDNRSCPVFSRGKDPLSRPLLITGLSLAIHLSLAVLLVGIDVSLTKARALSDAVRVDLVASHPPAEDPSASPDDREKGNAAQEGDHGPDRLDPVEKEAAPPDRHPELFLSKLVPPDEAMQGHDLHPDSEKNTFDDFFNSPGDMAGNWSKVPHSQASWVLKVKAQVYGSWKTPPESAFMPQALQSTYLLRISRHGELLDRTLIISSGNSPFDRSILLALGSVRRVPPPPPEAVGHDDYLELTVSFNPPAGSTR
jgi:TonB family protein